MAIGAILPVQPSPVHVATSLRQLYLFYFFNALSYLCRPAAAGALSNWFKRLRAGHGIAYVGIGVGGMIVPWLVLWFTRALAGHGHFDCWGISWR
jgi:hypothetical protein